MSLDVICSILFLSPLCYQHQIKLCRLKRYIYELKFREGAERTSLSFPKVLDKLKVRKARKERTSRFLRL